MAQREGIAIKDETKQKEELNAMPDNEQLIYFIDKGELTVNKAVEFYNKLDEMPRNVRRKQQKHLKRYW